MFSREPKRSGIAAPSCFQKQTANAERGLRDFVGGEGTARDFDHGADLVAELHLDALLLHLGGGFENHAGLQFFDGHAELLREVGLRGLHVVVGNRLVEANRITVRHACGILDGSMVDAPDLARLGVEDLAVDPGMAREVGAYHGGRKVKRAVRCERGRLSVRDSSAAVRAV